MLAGPENVACRSLAEARGMTEIEERSPGLVEAWSQVPVNLFVTIVFFWTAGTCLFSFVVFELCCVDREELPLRGASSRKSHVV